MFLIVNVFVKIHNIQLLSEVVKLYLLDIFVGQFVTLWSASACMAPFLCV